MPPSPSGPAGTSGQPRNLWYHPLSEFHRLEDPLANTRSAKKRIRQNAKRQARNKTIRTRARTYVKKARLAIAAEAPEAAPTTADAMRELDRAASRGVIHRKNASRRKSRLMRELHKTQAS